MASGLLDNLRNAYSKETVAGWVADYEEHKALFDEDWTDLWFGIGRLEDAERVWRWLRQISKPLDEDSIRTRRFPVRLPEWRDIEALVFDGEPQLIRSGWAKAEAHLYEYITYFEIPDFGVPSNVEAIFLEIDTSKRLYSMEFAFEPDLPSLEALLQMFDMIARYDPDFGFRPWLHPLDLDAVPVADGRASPHIPFFDLLTELWSAVRGQTARS